MDAQIDQNTLGHRYVQDTLGVTPKYAWHIDPFGLSASYALWFSKMNLTAWLFNRVDTRLKDLWHNETHLQFNWQPDGAGDNKGIFAHVLDTHYGAPEITYKGVHFHFEWEVFGGTFCVALRSSSSSKPDPQHQSSTPANRLSSACVLTSACFLFRCAVILVDPAPHPPLQGLGGGSQPGSQVPVSEHSPSTFYNATAVTEAEAFVALAKLRASWYKLGAPFQKVPAGHGAILVPFGDDMKFQNAHKQYSNMDKLMAAVNGNPAYGVTVKYGTIDDYMQHVNTGGPSFAAAPPPSTAAGGDGGGGGNGGDGGDGGVAAERAAEAAAAPAWPSFGGDFFPLGTNGNIYTSQIDSHPKDSDNEYWSGTFTTRPLMKGLVAKADGAKHTTEIAASIACARGGTGDNQLCSADPNADILLARAVTSVLQHHDNIPGTSAPDAALNLDLRLRASLSSSAKVMLLASGSRPPAGIVDTLAGNAAGVETTVVAAGSTVEFWNSLAQTRVEVVELALAAGSAAAMIVTDHTGAVVPSSVVPALPNVGLGSSESKFNRAASLHFEVSIPPLASARYTVAAAAAGDAASAPTWQCQTPLRAGGGAAGTDVTLVGGGVGVTFSGKTGRMSAVTINGGTAFGAMSQEFVQYHSSGGSNAYQFAPDRSKFPFGEPLINSTEPKGFRLCIIKTAVVERAVQSIAVTPPKGTGIDCSTEGSCQKTCHKTGGFNICPQNKSVYYCCAAKDAGCSGVYACGDLHDCACTANPQPPGPVLMLEETVSVFPAGTDNTIVTSTEYTMAVHDRELVTRYSTGLNNTVAGHYYGSKNAVDFLPVFETDSNGMLMMTRTTNKTQWPGVDGDDEAAFHVTMAVAGNYYPVASPGAIRIKDAHTKQAFAVVTDRARGVSSLNRGWVEVMIGRRCAEQGGITVDDTDHIVSKNWLLPAATAEAAAVAHRKQALRASTPLVPVVGSAAGFARMPLGTWRAAGAVGFDDNVHLLSLDRLGVETTAGAGANTVLLRVHHVFGAGETGDALSADTVVDLTAAIPAGVTFDVGSVKELPLSGLGDGLPVTDPTKVTLHPLETRTFEITLKRAPL